VPEYVVGLVISAGVGVVVFVTMMVLGPPPGYTCADGKPHRFGCWTPTGRGQQRTCAACGWTEKAFP
jgi:hypothetical protein